MSTFVTIDGAASLLYFIFENNETTDLPYVSDALAPRHEALAFFCIYIKSRVRFGPPC